MTEALQEKMKKEGYKSVDSLDVILDKTNEDPIIFINDKGETLSFEKLIVLAHEVKNEPRNYVILRPLDEIEGVDEDDVMAFFVDEYKDGNCILQFEEDEEITTAVFEKYYALQEMSKKENEEDEDEENYEDDILFRLLDETNKDPIVFTNDNGDLLVFDQVAVIPYKVKKELRLYCLLSPLQEHKGLSENDVIVFFVDMLDIDKDDDDILQVEKDEEVSSAVYDIYIDFLEKYQVEENAIKEAIMLQPEHQKQVTKLLKKRIKVLNKKSRLNKKQMKRDINRIARMLKKVDRMKSKFI